MKTKPTWTFAGIFSCAKLCGTPATFAANTLPTNPAGFAYKVISGATINPYAHPTGMLITGRCNRYDPLFASARAGGAEILAYLNAAEASNSTVCALDTAFYMGDLGAVPLWPFPTYGQRVSFANTHMTDVRVGSAWIDHVVEYVEDLMVEDKVDGVFLDVIGARLWGGNATLAEYDTWPKSEKDAWTERLGRSRRATRRKSPRDQSKIHHRQQQYLGPRRRRPSRSRRRAVRRWYLHRAPHSCVEPNLAAVANHAYSNLGHRRVIAIGTSTTDAQAWANVQGVTHASDQATYGTPSTPPIAFNRLTDRSKIFGRTTIGTTPSLGMAPDYKRASKFVLSENGTLLDLNMYMDGTGGATGEQGIRLVVYRDNGGVPGVKVTESITRWFAAGVPANWRSFTVPNVALNAGTYWIAIHSAATGQIVRNFGGGPETNWYGNDDTFFGGAADPFGAGTPGGGTLSVYATYTVGQ